MTSTTTQASSYEESFKNYFELPENSSEKEKSCFTVVRQLYGHALTARAHASNLTELPGLLRSLYKPVNDIWSKYLFAAIITATTLETPTVRDRVVENLLGHCAGLTLDSVIDWHIRKNLLNNPNWRDPSQTEAVWYIARVTDPVTKKALGDLIQKKVFPTSKR